MSDKLEKFVVENKQQFDSAKPSKGVWEKIDAALDVKDSTQISSNWLSKFKYIALSASVLVIAVYFISTSLNSSASVEQALVKKNQPIIHSEHNSNINQHKPELSASKNSVVKENNTPGKKEPASIIADSYTNDENILTAEEDNTLYDTEDTDEFLDDENEEPKANTENVKKETKTVRKKKKPAIYIPEDTEELNNYSAILYDGSDICSVVGAFKCPGKVENSKNNGKANLGTGADLKTISCFRLERLQSITAVWFKGKTDKKMSVLIKKGFKNIFLIKPNGKKYTPVAISHYFRGRTVIASVGRNMNLAFKDKVELVLFFKNAQPGDKVIIDGTLQTTIREKP